MISGTTLEFQNEISEVMKPIPFKFDKVKEQKIDHELTELLTNVVSCRVKSSQGQCISNIFLRNKPDGRIRIVLVLAEFNDKLSTHVSK